VHLRSEDKKWVKALEREGIKPDKEHIQSKVNMILININNLILIAGL